MFRTVTRSLSATTRSSLKIGLIPADGIGKEVIPVCPEHVPRSLQLPVVHRQPAKLLKRWVLTFRKLSSLILLLVGRPLREQV